MLKIFKTSITKDYIYFEYHGDFIYYLYPWNRKERKYKLYSAGLNSYFTSLKELKEAWKEYLKQYEWD